MSLESKMRVPSSSFWGKATEDHLTGCNVWNGSTSCGKNGKAYGIVRWRIDGRTRKLFAHRVAIALVRGVDYDDLAGFDVHHTCGNPLCINPAHLQTVSSEAHGRAHYYGNLWREVEGYAAHMALQEVAA